MQVLTIGTGHTLLTIAWAGKSRSEREGDLDGRTRGSSGRGDVGWNPNLRVEVADVGGGVLVALRRVLSEKVRAHARRDARRHGLLALAAGGGGEEFCLDGGAAVAK